MFAKEIEYARVDCRLNGAVIGTARVVNDQLLICVLWNNKDTSIPIKEVVDVASAHS